MIFQALNEAAQRGELILIDGGICRWHLRKDGQITIREIISIRPGAGTEMLEKLKQIPGASQIVAKCPVDLLSNFWYQKKGFVLLRRETTTTGRAVNIWILKLS